MSKTIENWTSQVRKGILDFVILLYLERREFYGYDLIKTIKDEAHLDISEGTLYPLLNRLEKDGLLTTSWVNREAGNPRKYHYITADGRLILAGMKKSWLEFTIPIHRLLAGSS